MVNEVENNRLAEIRINKSLTQAQVEADTEISQYNLSRYERRDVRISVEKAAVLADYYEVSLDEIFMRDTKCKYELELVVKNKLHLVVELVNSKDISEILELLTDNNYIASVRKGGIS